MKVGVTPAAVEYCVALTALSVPVAIAGFHYAGVLDQIFSSLLTQLTAVAMVVGG